MPKIIDSRDLYSIAYDPQIQKIENSKAWNSLHSAEWKNEMGKTLKDTPWEEDKNTQLYDIATINLWKIRSFLSENRPRSHARWWFNAATYFTGTSLVATFFLGVFFTTILSAGCGLPLAYPLGIALFIGLPFGAINANILGHGENGDYALTDPVLPDRILLLKQLEKEAEQVVSEVSFCKKAQVPAGFLTAQRVPDTSLSTSRIRSTLCDSLKSNINIGEAHLYPLIAEYVCPSEDTYGTYGKKEFEEYETKLRNSTCFEETKESLMKDIKAQITCYFGWACGYQNANASKFVYEIREDIWSMESLLNILVKNKDRNNLPTKVRDIINDYVEKINDSFALDSTSSIRLVG